MLRERCAEYHESRKDVAGNGRAKMIAVIEGSIAQLQTVLNELAAGEIEVVLALTVALLESRT